MRLLTTLTASFALTAAALLAAAPAAHAGEIDWVPTLKKGLEEAKRSGRSVLYVTLWKPGT